jgi:hypothetical protein
MVTVEGVSKVGAGMDIERTVTAGRPVHAVYARDLRDDRQHAQKGARPALERLE